MVGELTEVVVELAKVVGKIAEVPDAGMLSSSAWRQHGVIRANPRLTGGFGVSRGYTMNHASPVSHRLTPDPPVSDQPR